MTSANRLQKEKFVADLHGRFSTAQAAVLAQQAGITVARVTALRAELRKQSVSVQVIRNTLARRAVEGTPMAGLKEHMKGPSVLAWTDQDPVGLARALINFSVKEKDKLKIRAGILQGKLLTAQEVAALATIPSREILLARLAGSLQAPYAGLVYALSGILRKFVYALDAVRRKKEEGK
jgi:large subunit ribosomal protein L10